MGHNERRGDVAQTALFMGFSRIEGSSSLVLGFNLIVVRAEGAAQPKRLRVQLAPKDALDYVPVEVMWPDPTDAPSVHLGYPDCGASNQIEIVTLAEGVTRRVPQFRRTEVLG